MKTNYDYMILTPSYNRADMLESILVHLQMEAIAAGYRVIHLVIDDGSDASQRYSERMMKWQKHRYKIKYFRLRRNHGRDGFWKIYNRLFEEARKLTFDYAIGLADDLLLCRDFLRRTARYLRFCQAQDPRVVCANLFSRFPTNWGTTRYVDGVYIADRGFFEALQWRIRIISPERFEGSRRRKHRSSGVHQQITTRLAGSHGIAPVGGISYVKPRDTESVMFPADKYPDRPPSTPWECNFIDD